MSGFDDLDEASFTALAPTVARTSPDVRLSFVKFRDGASAKLQITFRTAVLAEIGGPRFEISWNGAKRLLLVKEKVQGPFEATNVPHGKSQMLRMLPPVGVVASEAVAEPEYYVDAIGKRILIEVPVEFGGPRALPPPMRLKLESPKASSSPITAGEIEAGNREILQALGVTETFPQQIAGVKFQPAEARILEALYRNTELTMEALLAATHDPKNGDDDREVKIVDVWLCKMRPKLAQLDLSVKTIWGGRRALDAASKGRLREMLREAGAAA